MRGAFYVTGTDTGIGKTRVSVALLGALREAGIQAGGMKPLASGCEEVGGGWRNEDAEALLAASVPGLAYAEVNPIALPLATAPEIAAAAAGVVVELAPLEAAYARLRSQVELLAVEGVGGWLAPLAPTLMQADLVRRLQLPVLLVVGLRLGCINHALLSLRALRSDGARVLGWIGSAVDPDFAHAGAYRDILRARLGVPCLGILEHGAARIMPDPLPALRVLLEQDRRR
jgi:dethiobiotin synthetase